MHTCRPVPCPMPEPACQIRVRRFPTTIGEETDEETDEEEVVPMEIEEELASEEHDAERGLGDDPDARALRDDGRQVRRARGARGDGGGRGPGPEDPTGGEALAGEPAGVPARGA